MKPIYILIPGINTDRLQMLSIEQQFKRIKDSEHLPGKVRSFFYGDISVFKLILDFATMGLIQSSAIASLTNILRQYRDEHRPVNIIAHSNGTYVLRKALERLGTGVNLFNIALFNGTWKCSYDMNKLSNKVGVVFNYCSTNDSVIHMLPKFIGRGNSGYWGFRHRLRDGEKIGQKANVNINCEGVWGRVDGDKNPLVYNLHNNEMSHCEVLKEDIYIRDCLMRLKRATQEDCR